MSPRPADRWGRPSQGSFLQHCDHHTIIEVAAAAGLGQPCEIAVRHGLKPDACGHITTPGSVLVLARAAREKLSCLAYRWRAKKDVPDILGTCTSRQPASGFTGETKVFGGLPVRS